MQLAPLAGGIPKPEAMANPELRIIRFRLYNRGVKYITYSF